MTVVVSSENTRPSQSLPMKSMATAVVMRPLRPRQTLWHIVLATWGKGPGVYPQTMLTKKRMMANEM